MTAGVVCYLSSLFFTLRNIFLYQVLLPPSSMDVVSTVSYQHDLAKVASKALCYSLPNIFDISRRPTVRRSDWHSNNYTAEVQNEDIDSSPIILIRLNASFPQRRQSQAKEWNADVKTFLSLIICIVRCHIIHWESSANQIDKQSCW